MRANMHPQGVQVKALILNIRCLPKSHHDVFGAAVVAGAMTRGGWRSAGRAQHLLQSYFGPHSNVVGPPFRGPKSGLWGFNRFVIGF